MSSEKDDLQDRLNREDNEVKVSAALSVGVDAIYVKYDKMERTEENALARAKELASLWSAGMNAMRNQVISETIKILTASLPKDVDDPNYAQKVLQMFLYAAVKGGRKADESIIKFMEKAKEASGGRVEFELISDANDPRIVPIDKNFPNCEGSA